MIQISLERQAVEQVLNALAHRPYIESAALIQNITQQAEAQIAAEAQPVAANPPAAKSRGK
ncbi:MAG: hypothetical protein QX198_04595 [Methylococcaceae bacterium]